MNPSPVYSEPFAGDPLEAAHRLRRRPGTLLLHTQTPAAGRRSALLFDPVWEMREEAGTRRWRGEHPGPAWDRIGLLEMPHRLGRALPPRPNGEDLPLPGIAGILSYEAGARAHGIADRPGSAFGFPEAWLAAYDLALLFGAEEEPRLVAADLGAVAPRRVFDPRRRIAHARALLGRRDPRSDRTPAGLTGPVRPLDPGAYATAFHRIHRHLLDGDLYQIDLTGFVRAFTDLDPFEAFLEESRRNPAPMAAFARLDEGCITSHSPERLLSVRGETAATEPIKGTAAGDDLTGLQSSAKDRAEHVMIVDLCRNDLGRLAEPGSVRVVAHMQGLRLRGLHHLVSRIEASVPRSRQAALLADLFPGGSIVGAPKRRAMQRLREIESEGRGPYTGSIGWAGPGGDMDWNIAIRTAIWRDGEVAFGCGGGIVVDSTLESEYAEAMLKARSFFDSLSTLAARRAGAREEVAP